ncbi:MAG: flavodoxin domain-containing protein [Limnochordia bacterium]
MRTLIAYSTRHGTTLRHAEALARVLPGEVALADLRQEPAIDISPFGTVIVGGAIYFGHVSAALREFCLANIEELKQKRLGLFICCWHEGEEAQKQLQAAYPLELLDAAKAKAAFGGEMDLTTMSFIERLITRLVGKVSKSASRYSEKAAAEFVQALQDPGR